MNVAAFFMLAVLSSEVFGVVLAGYASASKWSLFGGVREAAQVVSYEVPRAMCVVVPICVAGTLNLNTIGAAANRLVLALERLPRSVHVRGVLHLLHHRHGQLQAGPVRSRRGRERTRRRLPHRIQRLPLVDLLPGGIRQHVRRQRAGRAAVPRRLAHRAFCRSSRAIALRLLARQPAELSPCSSGSAGCSCS